jgi:hypothetical protein
MIRTTVDAVIKQPFIIITVGITMLVLAVFNIFIPVMAMILGIVNMTGGSFFDSVLAVIQMLIEPGNIPMILISLGVLTLLFSVAVGLLLPGYLLVINDGLSKNGRVGHFFLKGIERYFLKFFLISIRSFLLTAFMGVFIIISSVPAIVITRVALISKPNLMIAAVFIDVLTVCVIFLGLSFYTIYSYMWYIASLTASKKPFRAGKAAADRCFWKIVMGLLVFDIVFAVGLLAVYMIDDQVFRYITGWIFTTCYFTTLAVFLMQNFRDSSRIPIETV